MKARALLALLMVPSSIIFGATLDVASSTLDITGVSTTATTFENAQAVGVNTSGEVLVLGSVTCSANQSATGGYGRWRLSSEAQISTYIERSMSSSIDNGSLSVVHVFTNVAADSSVYLQHQVSRGRQTITTRGANLISIPLTTSTGETLNYGIGQQSSGTRTSSQVCTNTGLMATVSLDCTVSNGVYFAASFNSTAVDSPEDGVWKLQYRKVGDEQWLDTGSEIRRSMSTAGGYGAITLYALEEGLDEGEYEVALGAKSLGGALVETLNGTLVAVALSYTNSAGGHYFDGFSMVTNDLVTETEIEMVSENPDLNPAVNLESFAESGSLVAMMSFRGNSGEVVGEFGDSGTFGLLLDESLESQENERYFEFSADYGSVASVGHFEGFSDGDHRLVGYRSDNVLADYVTLVGFLTETTPDLSAAPMGMDADFDGIPDSWELEYFGETSTTDPEAMAANGLNTLAEAYVAGIDPTDSMDVFGLDHLTAEDDAGVVLEWVGVTGRVYTVYWAENLIDGFTEVLQSNIAWNATTFTDTIHQAEAGGFYKIEVELAP